MVDRYDFLDGLRNEVSEKPDSDSDLTAPGVLARKRGNRIGLVRGEINETGKGSEALKNKVRKNRKLALRYIISTCQIDGEVPTPESLEDNREYVVNARYKNAFVQEVLFSLTLRAMPSGDIPEAMKGNYKPTLRLISGTEANFDKFISGFRSKGLEIRYGSNGQYTHI